MAKVSKKIKILCVNPGINYCGGIESYSVNYFRHLNKEKFSMDFVAHHLEPLNYQKELDSLGAHVYVLPEFGGKNILEAVRAIQQFFLKHHDYDIIHCNMANAAPFYFYYAKKYGIRVRILHSHQAKYADKISHAIRNIPLIWLGKKMATAYFACSKLAGDFLYQKKSYYLIPNAIDVSKFRFQETVRKKIRKGEQLQDDEVALTNIGRFCNQKNQLFLIDIFEELVKDNTQKYKLFLVGSGDLKDAIVNKIQMKGLTDRVIVKDPISNVYEFLQGMDIMVMPSLYEGLPVIGVEAQASSLPCVFSDAITPEAQINDNVYFVSLLDDVSQWVSVIQDISLQRESDNHFIHGDFNIENSVKKLEQIYESLCDEVRSSEFMK